MTGIQYVTDVTGRKVAVQIDLKKHKALWEDIQDGLIAQERKRESGVPYEQYRSTRLKSRPKR
ncbi:MAG: hypothetical protein ACKV2U_12760 [Bryobacteraceae bacterium]